MPSVGEIGRAIGAKVIGNERVAIRGVASIASAAGGSLVFVEDEKNLAAALKSAAGAVIAGAFAENATSHKPLLIAAHPRLAFARAAAFIQAQITAAPSQSKSADRGGGRRGIDPTAVVLPTATIGHSVTIDPWTFVGD